MMDIREAQEHGDKKLEFETEAHKQNSLIGTVTNDKLMPIDKVIAQHLAMVGKPMDVKQRLGKMKYSSSTNYYAVKTGLIHPQEPSEPGTTDKEFYEPKVMELLSKHPGEGYQPIEIARIVRYLQWLGDKEDKKEFKHIMKQIAKKHKEIKTLTLDNELYYYIG